MTKSKKITALEAAAIAKFESENTVTVVEAVKKESKKRVERISTGDTNFDLYVNALPKPLRKWAADTKQNARALYKEYRTLKAAGMIEKYGAAASEHTAK